MVLLGVAFLLLWPRYDEVGEINKRNGVGHISTPNIFRKKKAKVLAIQSGEIPRVCLFDGKV